VKRPESEVLESDSASACLWCFSTEYYHGYSLKSNCATEYTVVSEAHRFATTAVQRQAQQLKLDTLADISTAGLEPGKALVLPACHWLPQTLPGRPESVH
jgi:hypothetical protein